MFTLDARPADTAGESPNTHIMIASLRRRRTELLQKLQGLRAEAKEARRSLVRVRADLDRLCPSFPGFSGVGRSLRAALADGPLSTSELTCRFMIEKGLDMSDKPLCRRVRESVYLGLKELRRRGLVASERAGGRTNTWKALPAGETTTPLGVQSQSRSADSP